jgi:hypothetical protein
MNSRLIEKTHLVAIDPWAMILPDSIYPRFVEARHPHVPAIETLSRLAGEMTASERTVVLENANAMLAMAKDVVATVGRIAERTAR